MLINATITNGFFHLTATEQRDKKFFIYVLLLSVVVIPDMSCTARYHQNRGTL